MKFQLRPLIDRICRGAVAIVAVFSLALAPIAAHADNYGNNVYGSDVYNSSTTPTPTPTPAPTPSDGAASSSATHESTVVATPTGLEVAINLADGQEIPYAGYNIIITPLNGEGTSFDKAEIYLDGKLVFTGSPDSTGTLKWLWESSKLPATKVKIIIYGPGTATTTHEFSVTIGKDLSTTTAQPATTNNEATSTPATGGGFPWWAYALIGGLVLLVIIIIWFIVRRRRQSQLPPPPTPMSM